MVDIKEWLEVYVKLRMKVRLTRKLALLLHSCTVEWSTVHIARKTPMR